MDIAELAARISLSTRRLRYVFDHKVLPGTKTSGEGRGIPRSFTEYEAFGVALAALLLESGLKRSLVAACLTEAAEPIEGAPSIERSHLYRGYVAKSSWLEVGDGIYLRLSGVGQPGVSHDFDSGWLPLRSWTTLPKKYTPLVLVKIDLTALRRRIGK